NVCFLDGGSLSFAVAVFDRASGRNLSRIMTSGREEEEWGVRPSKGCEIMLSREENATLARRFHDQRILPPPGQSLPSAIDDASHRQLSLALDCLRKKPTAPR